MKAIRITSTRAALFTLLPFLSMTGCAATGSQAVEEESSWKNPSFTADIVFSDLELDEIEFKDDLGDILGDRITDVDRRRAGVRVSVGSKVVRAYAQVFGEEWDKINSNDLDTGSAVSLDDLIGVGLGVVGSPVLKTVTADVRVVLPYRAGFNVVFGEGTFTDTDGIILKTASERGDLVYLEREFSVGIGVNARGFQPSFGLYSSLLTGLVDDEIVADNDDDELFFEGSNTGLYFEFSYEDSGSPMRFGLRGTVGDVEGLEAFFGVAL